MNQKTLMALAILGILIISGCIQKANPHILACTEDAKICPDGTAVGRDPANNCEFFECSTEKPIPVEPDGGIGTTPDAPIPVEPDGGIGSTPPSGAKLHAIQCTPEQRGIDACTADYTPVCGWSDPEKIQCIKYPCAQTYSNACSACKDENVAYYTLGECPSEDQQVLK